MIYEGLIDKLLVHFTGAAYKDQVVDAKRDFFERSSVIDEEDQQFEIRMSQFLDWYLFSRKLIGVLATPVEYALQTKDFVMSADERPQYERLAAHQHSLYEFLKLRGSDVYVKDLFSGKKIWLKDSPMTLGFNYDECFDARLIPFEDSFVFAKGFCFHPVEAKRFILKEIRAVKNQDLDAREAFLLRLLKMRYKLDQYKHIKLEQIYTNDSKVKF